MSNFANLGHAACVDDIMYQLQLRQAVEARVAELERIVKELEPRAAFGDQCWQDQCEGALIEQTVVDRVRRERDQRIAELERWEIGFRNIVTILIGARAEFEIPDVVELVRSKVCALAHAESQRNTGQALISKIQTIVHEAEEDPNERWSDFDVLDQGVRDECDAGRTAARELWQALRNIGNRDDIDGGTELMIKHLLAKHADLLKEPDAN